jgi:CBS-domain-containing membrane protein
MMTEMRPLLSKTAADVMSRDVVTIPSAMSLPAAAHRLASARITGAPVVDGAGRCIGILSATDFVLWAEKGERAVKQYAAPLPCGCADWQILDFEMLPEDEVSRFMTTDVVTAEPTATVGELARTMLDAHVHRVIVVDRQGRPIGVVSSMDILAAVASEVPDNEE